MSDYRGASIALEAIDIQNGALFKALTAIFAPYVTGYQPDQKAQKLIRDAVEKTIVEHTGITAVFTMTTEETHVLVPVIDSNHAFFGHYRHHYKSSDGMKMIDEGQGLATGQVDLAKSRVSGDFTKCVVTINLDVGLFRAGFSAEEMAALVLHELGHFFTYLELLDRTCTTNLVLAGLDQVLKGADAKKREYALRKVGDIYAMPKEVVDQAVAGNSDETTISVYLTHAMGSIRSATGHSFYDMNSWEMASDQFAARHGAGRYMVTALAKMNRIYGAPALQTQYSYFMMEMASIVKVFIQALLAAGGSAAAGAAVAVGTVGSYAIAIVALFVAVNLAMVVYAVLQTAYLRGAMVPVYDRDRDRVLRVRRQLIEQSKQPRIPVAMAKRLLEDVKVVDEAIAQYNADDPWLDKVAGFLFKRHRDRRDSVNLQKDLEGLALNDLFLKSLELKHA